MATEAIRSYVQLKAKARARKSSKPITAKPYNKTKVTKAHAKTNTKTGIKTKAKSLKKPVVKQRKTKVIPLSTGKIKADKMLIAKVVKELVGEEALPIVFYLRGKHRVSEFKIAEDLKLEIHVLRNLLYRLLEHNILTFKRKKDKIKGWYISYWDFNEHEIPYLEIKYKEDKLKKLTERLEREYKNEFYMCKNACVRMSFEEAMDFHFHCPECGNVMMLIDNKRTIMNIKQQIKQLEKEIKQLKAKYRFFKRIGIE